MHRAHIMNHRNFILWNIFCFINLINTVTCAENDTKKLVNSAQMTDVCNLFPGIYLIFINDEIRIKFDAKSVILQNTNISALKRLSGKLVLNETSEARVKDDSDDGENKNGLMKFGSMIALVPLLLQILSLPGALASIKVSLLKSLLVGKLALALIIFNALKNAQKTEVVVVHETHYQQHSHYHHQYLDSDDDDHDNDFFGRKRRR